MGTTGGVNRNLRFAEGADFRGGSRLDFFLHRFLFTQVVQGVHQFNDAEQYDGDDEEIDQGHNKGPVLELNAESEEGQGAEIRLNDQADQGGDNVVDQGVDDGLEGGTDHNTDGHIDHVAAIDKFFEFRNNLFHKTHSNPFFISVSHFRGNFYTFLKILLKTAGSQ